MTQFDSDESIYLVAEFTGGASSFIIEFRRTSVSVEAALVDEAGETDSDTIEFKIGKE